MRTLALLVLAAACGGGGSKSAQAPAPAPAPDPAPAPKVGTTIQVNAERPADAMPRAGAVEAQPAPAPAPPPTTPAPINSALAYLDKTQDKAGGVPGVAGWTLKRVEDKTVCGGTRIAIARGKRKLDADEAALAKVYGLVFPADLNFDPNNKARSEASFKKFNEFVEKLKKTGETAKLHFETKLTSDAVKNDPAASTAMIARLAQVHLQLASTLVRAPIPKDVRTGELAGEKIDAYCSKMDEVAVPLATRGQEALTACAKSGAPAGWYSAFCATATE